MKNITKKLTTIAALSLMSISAYAQDNKPTVTPIEVKDTTVEDYEFPNGSFGNLKEGVDYIKVKVDKTSSKNVVDSNYNKPVILDFFWYGCGHCDKVRPMVKSLGENYSNVKLVHQPAAFDGWEAGTKMSLIFKAMDVENQAHDPAFEAIHKKRKNLFRNQSQLEDFLKDNKIDVAKFNDLAKSFQIQNAYVKAQNITKNYQLTSTPSVGVYYKGYAYLTAPQLAKGYAETVTYTQTILDSILRKDAELNKK